jgi:hypothetical protein
MHRVTGPYRTYTFNDKDPVIGQLKVLVDIQGVDFEAISAASGVSVGTLREWFYGKTRRPQHATARAVARTLKHDLQLVQQS